MRPISKDLEKDVRITVNEASKRYLNEKREQTREVIGTR